MRCQTEGLRQAVPLQMIVAVPPPAPLKSTKTDAAPVGVGADARPFGECGAQLAG
jgi:hypothetical protein